MQEARYYTKAPENKTLCSLCPHHCLIPENEAGKCRVRINRNGVLYSGVYGQIAAIQTDPVEKKPLYHFYPGSTMLSIGTAGCNLHCDFCQNYGLAQLEPYHSSRNKHLTPGQLVNLALGNGENTGIAYTYNEPVVFFEMMMDTAKIARAAGLKNAVISNGFIQPDPLSELLKTTDAFNIDLKAFNDIFYKKVTGGRLKPVLNTLKMIHESGRHLEITLLVIPGLNDSPDEFNRMLDWIAGQLSPEIPLHLSRYFPSWKMNLPPTPLDVLQKLAQLARWKLQFVYTGNVPGNNHASTFCPQCHNLLIERHGYSSSMKGLTSDKKCSGCGHPVPIVM
jgi:pyruvate formate lyase activating enzyme